MLKCLERNYDFFKVIVWIRVKKEDFEIVKSFGIKEIGIFVLCLDYYIFKKFKMIWSQVMK